MYNDTVTIVSAFILIVIKLFDKFKWKNLKQSQVRYFNPQPDFQHPS